MARVRSHLADEMINPYIALSDLAINLVLILVFFMAGVVAVGRAGWEQVRYRDSQAAFKQALEQTLPPNLRPYEHMGKHDPPGAQRWVFGESALFKPNTAQLLPEGRHALVLFAEALRQHRDKWRRIRIEGHTLPPAPGEADNWELSTSRAAKVARVFAGAGHIPSFYIAVSGRAGQNRLVDNPLDPANERVEIVIEYAQKAANPNR